MEETTQSADQLPTRDRDDAHDVDRCWDCGQKIGLSVLICPSCNANQKLPMRAVYIVAAIFGIVAVAAVATIVFGDSDPAANAFQAPSTKASQERQQAQ